MNDNSFVLSKKKIDEVFGLLQEPEKRLIKGVLFYHSKRGIIYSNLEERVINNLLLEINLDLKQMNEFVFENFYTSKNGEYILVQNIGDYYSFIVIYNSDIKFSVAKKNFQKFIAYFKPLLE